MTNSLIALAINLAGMLLIYSMMAHVLSRLAWHRRGMFGVIATIVVAQLFWIVPALLIVGSPEPANVSSCALWFGNWLVSGFGAVLLWQRATSIPRQLEDSARLDGCGWLGIWWHVILPLVRRDLWLIAIFTVMATQLAFWRFVTLSDTGNPVVLFQRASSPGERIGVMLAVSLLGTLPLIAIFFLAKRRIRQTAADPCA